MVMLRTLIVLSQANRDIQDEVLGESSCVLILEKFTIILPNSIIMCECVMDYKD